MSEKGTDYKDTLNLPNTGFPMKANLTKREPETIAFWEENKIAEKVLKKNEGRTGYILHDGPPYANGHIHIGHALNKTLKDIIVKYKAMRGHYAPYVPGWDCHGLPIELQVDKSLGKEKNSVSTLQKRKLCREYAAKFIDIQRDEFRRLGIFGSWDKPYLTMTNEYEGAIVREFVTLLKGGYVYSGKKPVHWCPSCVTALAEAEVEYAQKESPSVYVKFKLKQPEAYTTLGLPERDTYIVIWTTTPWTLPANLALAVNSNINYAAVMDAEQKEYFIVADSLVNDLHAKGVLPTNNTYKIFPGKSMDVLQAEHPFLQRPSKVIAEDFVSVEEGTGIVHIAPGHGEDDYAAGLRNGLEIYAPVDDRGRFTGVNEALDGEFVFKANPAIIETMRVNGSLLYDESIEHSYPHCWRCKKPVIFRATEQWFISMDSNGLRERALKEIDNVAWVPRWGRQRIYGMVEGRPDWCISRQRSWGVPITMIECTGCGAPVMDDAVLDGIVKMIEENGSDVWFEKETAEFLPKGYKCQKCGADEFEKETDILDVWFDSGVSHAAVLQHNPLLTWPADLYLEGSDQHRGWFQSSLLTSVGTRGAAPYRTVLTHGFVVDGKGKKMSKSLGNVISPEKVIKASGAEILRLWASAEDYQDEIRISGEILDRLREAYRKIRNTARFLLGNLQDFDGGDYSRELTEIDRWAMSRLQDLVGKVTAAYERFDFHEVYHRLYSFCIVEMSSFYLDILKDRLYTMKADSPDRRASQWVFRQVLGTMTRLMAPVLSFTAEEIWGFLEDETEESVFLASFPEPDDSFRNAELEARWAVLISVRDEVNKALELKRAEKFIGNSLEAKVVLYPPEGETGELIKDYAEFLPTLFIVSAAGLGSGAPPEGAYAGETVKGLHVLVEHAPGDKCPRCWNRSPSAGSHADAPGLCDRCYANTR